MEQRTLLLLELPPLVVQLWLIVMAEVRVVMAGRHPGVAREGTQGMVEQPLLWVLLLVRDQGEAVQAVQAVTILPEVVLGYWDQEHPVLVLQAHKVLGVLEGVTERLVSEVLMVEVVLMVQVDLVRLDRVAQVLSA